MDYESVAQKLEQMARDLRSIEVMEYAKDRACLLVRSMESKSEDPGLDALLARLDSVVREANPMSDLVTIRVGDVRRAIEQIRITARSTEQKSVDGGEQ